MKTKIQMKKFNYKRKPKCNCKFKCKHELYDTCLKCFTTSLPKTYAYFRTRKTKLIENVFR